MAVYILWGYNRFIKLKNQVKEAYGGVEVQLKRRHDLIPALVETVKGYQIHEKSTLEKVAALRTQNIGSSGIRKKAKTEGKITKTLKSLFALAEAYPELKADQQFLKLQKNLVEVEDTLQMARRYYNGAVRLYNTFRESFPSNLLAHLFGFPEEPYFDAPEWQEAPPEVTL